MGLTLPNRIVILVSFLLVVSCNPQEDPPGRNPISCVQFSPSGKMLVSADGARNVIWETKAWNKMTAIASKGYCPVFSPDGQLWATGEPNGTLKLWSTEDGRLLRSVDASTRNIWALDFSPDGRTLASAGEDGVIRLWNIAAERILLEFKGHTGAVWSLAYSPDGTLLGSGSLDRTLKLWNPSKTGPPLRTIRAAKKENGVVDIAFSPDGTVVATAESWDKTATVWEVNTGRKISVFAGHTSDVVDVAFSADGRLLATSSGDKTIKLWDTEKGKEIRTLVGHELGVWSISFHPSGRLLASGSGDGSIKIWEVNTGKLVRSLRLDDYKVK